ncbi:lambda-exonuclease family protein [Breoghania sp.]|uniref:YqaJ viral recombinase family nuclease n=1 Tax=Breoghania sp. TaxID=2065378 RepID=UPI002AA7EF8F|nr:YqaJ viral recombinase family protein [Breoghania sp.]
MTDQKNPRAKRAEPWKNEHCVWHYPRKESTWKKLREGQITATAAAALFGVSPYMTAYELYQVLTGTLSVEIGENERMTWGKRLEPVIAAGICEDNGWNIVDARRYMFAISTICDHMAASPDFLIEDPARPELGVGLLEIKNVDKFVALDSWEDEEAPAHIEFQLQHQMGATGLKWGAVGALVGGNSVRTIERTHDAEVIGEIMRRINDMCQRVAERREPSPDWLKDYDTIRAVYRDAEPAKSFDLDNPAPDSAFDVDVLQTLIANAHEKNVAAKLADDDKKRAQSELLHYIGDTETVFGESWKVSATTTHKAAYVAEFKETSFRNLRVTKRTPKAEKPANKGN